MENANRDELLKRMDDLRAFLREQPTAVTEYDEKLVRRLIEKVTVYEDRYAVEFKSGVIVDVIKGLHTQGAGAEPAGYAGKALGHLEYPGLFRDTRMTGRTGDGRLHQGCPDREGRFLPTLE